MCRPTSALVATQGPRAAPQLARPTPSRTARRPLLQSEARTRAPRGAKLTARARAKARGTQGALVDPVTPRSPRPAGPRRLGYSPPSSLPPALNCSPPGETSGPPPPPAPERPRWARPVTLTPSLRLPGPKPPRARRPPTSSSTQRPARASAHRPCPAGQWYRWRPARASACARPPRPFLPPAPVAPQGPRRLEPTPKRESHREPTQGGPEDFKAGRDLKTLREKAFILRLLTYLVTYLLICLVEPVNRARRKEETSTPSSLPNLEDEKKVKGEK